MKKILVPINFSPLSRIASEYACYFGKIIGAEVHLLHVVEKPVSIESPVLEVTSGKLVDDECNSLLDQEITFLKEKYLVTAHGYALAGFTQSKINDVCDELEADLLVIGAGSTAEASIRKSKVPVMVIPQDASFLPVKHIVLAVDFLEIGNPLCFAILSEVVDKFDAGLTVVHVTANAENQDNGEAGKLQLAKLLSKVTYWYQRVEGESVEDAIQQFIQSHPADLLVMVAHRHSLLQRLFDTIHTRDISYQTNLPLLVLEDK